MFDNSQYGGIERRRHIDDKASLATGKWQGSPVQKRLRGARHLGIWAASQMGYEPADKSAYADYIVLNGDPVGQVRTDLRRKGIAPGERVLQELYESFLQDERDQDKRD